MLGQQQRALETFLVEASARISDKQVELHHHSLTEHGGIGLIAALMAELALLALVQVCASFDTSVLLYILFFCRFVSIE